MHVTAGRIATAFLKLYLKLKTKKSHQTLNFQQHYFLTHIAIKTTVILVSQCDCSIRVFKITRIESNRFSWKP